MADMILYEKTGCPYCIKVLSWAEQHGIAFHLKNVADEGVVEELVVRGGKKQVPYLIDPDAGVALYESDSIIEYLARKRGVAGSDTNTGGTCSLEW